MAKRFNKYIIFTVTVILFLHTAFIFAEPEIHSPAAVLIEYESGDILYDKNMDEPMYPASTTKIMTALLVLENLDLNKTITVPEDMGPAEGSAMYLLPGETFTVEELLEGLLIRSANDAAVLFAREIAGDVKSFAKMMNERAKEIGCTNTHFVNPNGLPDPEHTISPHDLALIAREAMHNDKFRELVKTPYIQIHATEQTPEIRYFRNTNKFLWCKNKTMNYGGKEIPIKYDVVDGIKTGYTEDAGSCLVSSGEKNGIRVIAVVLKDTPDTLYLDSRKLLDYGFDNFTSVNLIKAGDTIGKKDVPDTVQNTLEFYVKDGYSYIKNKKSKDEIKTETVLNDLNLPVTKDSIVGFLNIKKGDEILSSLPLYSKYDLESIYSFKNFKVMAEKYKYWVVIGIAALIILIALITFLFKKINSKYQRSKRYKHYKHLK